MTGSAEGGGEYNHAALDSGERGYRSIREIRLNDFLLRL
jgi:hypothetical protein